MMRARTAGAGPGTRQLGPAARLIVIATVRPTIRDQRQVGYRLGP